MKYPANLSESDRRWYDLIHQCRTSGKSDRQWLLENNICSPTFYYHVKQLRKKACDIPENTCNVAVGQTQEIVPLVIEDIRRLLTVYFEQNVTTEKFEEFDGERWIILND